METRSVDTGKAINYGWESVKKNFWYFIALAGLVLIIEGIFNHDEKNQLFTSLSFFVAPLLTAGYLNILFHYYDNNEEKLPLSQLFTQTKYYFNILGANILLCLIIATGLLLLIVPGIYWSLKYSMTINLIVDKNMGILEAMKESSAMTEGVKLPLLMFMFACLGVFILGALCLGVGIFVAVPIL